jgi:hypothetical protein
MDACQLQLISMFLRDYPAISNDSIDGMNLGTIFVDVLYFCRLYQYSLNINGDQ